MNAFAKLKSAFPGYTFSVCEQTLFGRVRDEEVERLLKPGKGKEIERLRKSGTDADLKAIYALARTVPTTAEGALALMDYVKRQEAERNPISDISDQSGVTVGERIGQSLAAFIRRQLKHGRGGKESMG
jgi:hypothetical protein